MIDQIPVEHRRLCPKCLGDSLEQRWCGLCDRTGYIDRRGDGARLTDAESKLKALARRRERRSKESIGGNA